MESIKTSVSSLNSKVSIISLLVSALSLNHIEKGQDMQGSPAASDLGVRTCLTSCADMP